MAEHPIVFSKEMILALLAHRKSQTRRVIRGAGNSWLAGRLLGDYMLEPPYQYQGQQVYNWKGKQLPQPGQWCWLLQTKEGDCATFPFRCPYGQPGDRLWVKEGYYIQPKVATPIIPQPLHYAADTDAITVKDCVYKSPIFMPRWASRITLEVVNIRVERVQEISIDDAIAEGVCECSPDTGSVHSEYRRQFQELWDSINAKRKYPWRVNPWVFVVTFRMLE